LFPNEFVNARLLVRTLQGSILIPNAAIQRNGMQAFVFLIDDRKISIRNITEESTDGKNTAVVGLEPGQMVALSGFDKLQEGTSVTIEQSSQDRPSPTGGGF
jgi:multidrug efflux system membrane fusion protein